MKYSRREFVGRGVAVIGGVAVLAVAGSQAPVVAASTSALGAGSNPTSKIVEFEQWLLGTLPA